jgi:hypothetical protein
MIISDKRTEKTVKLSVRLYSCQLFLSSVFLSVFSTVCPCQPFFQMSSCQLFNLPVFLSNFLSTCPPIIHPIHLFLLNFQSTCLPVNFFIRRVFLTTSPVSNRLFSKVNHPFFLLNFPPFLLLSSCHPYHPPSCLLLKLSIHLSSCQQPIISFVCISNFLYMYPVFL